MVLIYNLEHSLLRTRNCEYRKNNQEQQVEFWPIAAVWLMTKKSEEIKKQEIKVYKDLGGCQKDFVYNWIESIMLKESVVRSY